MKMRLVWLCVGVPFFFCGCFGMLPESNNPILTVVVQEPAPATPVAEPVWVTDLSAAKAGWHNCALLSNGGVKCWGYGSMGTLGRGTGNVYIGDRPEDMGDQLQPINFGAGRRAVSLAGGSWFACAILNDGAVKCWGQNAYGVLGYGDTVARYEPPVQTVDLGTGKTAAQLCAGFYFTCARLDDGSVKCWGANESGQLGQGDIANRGDGAGEMGDNLPAIQLGTGKTAKAIACGSYHACAILNDDSLKCWGRGGSGRLGLGDVNSRGDGAGEMGDSLPIVNLGTGRTIKSIAAGSHQTCAVLDNDLVKCWGEGDTGRLGLGDTTDRGDTITEMGDSLPYVELGTGRTTKKVMMGYSHNCAILDNDQVKCWGGDFGTISDGSRHGQLGSGDSISRGDNPGEMGDALPYVNLGTGRTVAFLASQTNGDHSCAILENGQLKCWGWNAYGTLGLGNLNNYGESAGEMGDDLPIVNLGTGKTAIQVITTSYGTCALLSDQTVRCWGNSASTQGALGVWYPTHHVGDTPGEMGTALPYLHLGTGKKVTSLELGSRHGCAILDDEALKCWGFNSQGQLGLGDRADHGDEPSEMGDALAHVDLGLEKNASSLAPGTDHLCVVLKDGAVKCWGGNAAGQLGLGDTNSRGDNPGEMGDALPLVDLGTGKTAKQVASGYRFSCAILNDDTIKCWGLNDYGQLGLGNTASRGDAAGEMGDSLPIVSLGTGLIPKSLALGNSSSCVLFDNGKVKCWGQNTYGALGLGNVAHRGDGANEMGDNLPFVDLGTDRTAKSIHAGYSHNCVVLDNDQVKCWGYNLNGLLGLGDVAHRGDGANEMGDNLPYVNLGTGRTAKIVRSGSIHNCAVLDNGRVKCWGANANGYLGLGDTDHRGDGPGEMGDALPYLDLGI